MQSTAGMIVEMLFVEGNHFCMFCEKSGNCELQAMAYRLGITAPRYPVPVSRERCVDASHPTSWSITTAASSAPAACARRAMSTAKNVFQFVGRGPQAGRGERGGRLADTNLEAADGRPPTCLPGGRDLKKRVGYAVPVGQRKYDREPIGSEIETTGAGA
jgi:[NiFe] hydrogenase diaphorase moiety small subunit